MSWIRHVSSTQTADEFRFTGYYWGNTPSGGATLDHLLPSLLWSLLLLVCYSSICNNFFLIFSLSLSISWFEIKKRVFILILFFSNIVLNFQTVEPVDQLLQNVDPNKDRELWVRENKTGDIRPADMDIWSTTRTLTDVVWTIKEPGGDKISTDRTQWASAVSHLLDHHCCDDITVLEECSWSLRRWSPMWADGAAAGLLRRSNELILIYFLFVDLVFLQVF